MKRPNLCLIGVPESDRENEIKLENALQDIIQENFPNLERQANIQFQELLIPNGKEHQYNEEIASMNGQNSQLSSKW